MKSSPWLSPLAVAALSLSSCQVSHPSDTSSASEAEGKAHEVRRQQKIDLLVSQFLEAAHSNLETGYYTVALQNLSNVLELEPDNQEVRDLRDDVSQKLSEGIYVDKPTLEEQRTERNESTLEYLLSRTTERDRRLDASEIDGAIRDLEDAIQILRWNPYLLGPDQGHVVDQLRARLEELQAKRDADR